MPNENEQDQNIINLGRVERLKINFADIENDVFEKLKENRERKKAERDEILNRKFEDRPFKYGDTVSVVNIKRKTFKITDVFPFEGSFAYVLDNYPANVLEERLTLVKEANNAG